MGHMIGTYVGEGNSAAVAAHDAAQQAAAAMAAMAGVPQVVAISTQTVMVSPQEWVHVITLVLSAGN